MEAIVRKWPLNQVQTAFGVGYAAVVIAYYLQARVAGWNSVAFMPCLGVAVSGMIIGAVLYPSRRTAAWLLLLTGQVFNLLGAGTAVAYLRINGSTPYPSASDALELASYVFFVLGLGMLAKGGGFHVTARGMAIAAVVTGLTAGLFSWPVLIHPYAISNAISWFVKLVTIAYPSADVLLLFQVLVLALIVFAMRRFRTGTKISASFWLIALGTIGVLASDTTFAYAVLHWNYSQPSDVDAGWFIWFGAWALAFLGPEGDLSSKTWYLRAKAKKV